MTSALVIVVVVGALACPLRMLCALVRGRSPSCLLPGERCGATLPVRQRALARRVDGVAGARAGDRPAMLFALR